MPELLRDQCKLYQFFCGQWQLERTIYIKNSGSIHAKAYGIVCFTPGLSEDQLDYEERGKLTITGGISEISFSRHFRYKFNDHNMEVYFADGPDTGLLYQRYVRDTNNKLIPDQIHICSRDIYQGEYRISGTGSFSLNTMIDGPHKDFQIETLFTKKV